MITVLYGANSYAVERKLAEKLAALSPDFEVTKTRAESLAPEDLPQLLGGVSLFSPQRAIVIRDAGENKAVWERLGELLPDLDDDTPVILVDNNVDKRTRTYKALQKIAEVIELKELGEAELVGWLQQEARGQGTNIEPEAARFMIHYIGVNQAILAREVEKLALVSNSITRELIESYCEPTPQASAFEVVDAAVAGHADKVSTQVRILSQYEDPYRFFGLVSSQISTLITVAAAGQRSAQDIARDCSLHPYVVQKAVPVARRLGMNRLKHMVKAVADTDLQIKTSKGEPWQLVELMLMKIASL